MLNLNRKFSGDNNKKSENFELENLKSNSKLQNIYIREISKI